MPHRFDALQVEILLVYHKLYQSLLVWKSPLHGSNKEPTQHPTTLSHSQEHLFMNKSSQHDLILRREHGYLCTTSQEHTDLPGNVHNTLVFVMSSSRFRVAGVVLPAVCNVAGSVTRPPSQQTHLHVRHVLRGKNLRLPEQLARLLVWKYLRDIESAAHKPLQPLCALMKLGRIL